MGNQTQLIGPGGKKVTVGSAHAENFRGFLNDYTAQGGNISSIGGFNDRNIAGTNIQSNHGKDGGRAIDINMSARNKVSSGLPGGVEAENALADKWGLRSGATWRNPDRGHFEVHDPAKAQAALQRNQAIASGKADPGAPKASVPDDGGPKNPFLGAAKPGQPHGGPAAPGAKLPGAAGGMTANELGVSPEQWNAYRQGLADIESRGGDYSAKGGAGGNFDGAYQMGGAAKTDAARALGEGVPDRAAFRGNPQQQERFLDAYTRGNHRTMMQKSQAYRDASPERKLQMLGHAHSGGATGASNAINRGGQTTDAWGKGGNAYEQSIARRQSQIGRGGAPGATGPLAAGAARPAPAPPPVAAGNSDPAAGAGPVGAGPAAGAGAGAGATSPAADQWTALRGQLEAPIRPSIEAPSPPSQLVPQFRRASARREVNREVRESRWDSYADIGAA